MAEIVLDQIGKRFSDGTAALKAVSLTIRDGEFFILVGPSGCGKSTLLNMIVGLEDVTEGEIRVDGKGMNAVDPKDRNMAMVFQSYALYPHMTVRENMAFPLKLAKVPKEEISKRVAQAAEILGLSALLDRKPRSLSGGQRQRAAMGRAIVRRPSVFLLDEPLSNLDAKLRVQMRNEIARIQRRLGTTTLYVTHDQTEATTLGDRIAVMDKGEVQQVGTPRELYESPCNVFVAGFIGAPAMNFLPATWDGHRLTLPMTAWRPPEAQRKGFPEGPAALIAGIRPEDLQAVGPDSDDGHAPCFDARVERVEWLGAQCDIHCEVAGAISGRLSGWFSAMPGGDESADAGRFTLVASVDADSRAVEGQQRPLRLNASKLHLFDAETGTRLNINSR